MSVEMAEQLNIVIPRSDIRTFEEDLFNLRQSIRFFNGKLERFVLRGMIDLTHKIESNIEKLDIDIARIIKAERTAAEEIRNVRLHDNLNELKKQYNYLKNSFETEYVCEKQLKF